jgi:hypothetical protein
MTQSNRRHQDRAYASVPSDRIIVADADAETHRYAKSNAMFAIGRHISKLSGYAPALPTPFNDAGDIDLAAFERFCDLQINAGATALVVAGTTGEAPTLTPAEHQR